MKVVYLCKNGKPVVVKENDDRELEYPNDEWTDIAPSSDLYAPFYFDGNKWIGQEKERFEEELPEAPIDDKDIIIANLSKQILDQDTEIKSLKQDVATVLEILLQNGGNLNV